jgi:uncharacterized membrane protein SpoIIM required for sporulation
MLSNHWIALRKDNWNRLEAAAERAEKSGLKSFSAPELRDFGLLYRQAAADLSTVRTDRGSRTLEHYLNRLVARAHNFVYSGRQLSAGSLWRFLAFEYPRLFRKLLPYTTLATAICLFGGLLGVVITLVRPDFMHAMLGPRMIETIEHHKMWTDRILGSEPQAASGIMTNNITVCFMSFVSGITAGLGTIYYMFFNGFLIGVISTACAQHGMSLQLWSFVAAHGALELPSIFIAGGAGFRVAAGLLFPGYLSRKDSLALAGYEAIRLVAGTVPLLIVAGTLEGFLDPSRAPMILKFSLSAILLTALILWLTEGWRRQPIHTEA